LMQIKVIAVTEYVRANNRLSRVNLGIF